ncbi:ethanolamine ammonia-lyase, small subunit [Mycobacteroides abscessus subsp. massiliense]|nr:ethanolamine ammonia-lyase, small subunit [Mycobacteroides abscessus subsp. massiliense]
MLDLGAAHAIARDAVHVPLDIDRFAAEVGALGLGAPAVITSQVGSRAEYLRRPDLGRLPDDLSAVPRKPADIGFVLADGLSLGIYLTHLPRPGCTDADRNCISNIHPPDGLSYSEAARIAASLVGGALQLGRSGVELKDTSRASAIDDAGLESLG